MNSSTRLATRAAFLVFALSGAACGGEDNSSEACSAESCAPGFFCDEGDGVCKCRTDDACADDTLFCNSFGTCQKRPQCRGNSDCEDDFICSAGERSGGNCIPATSCGFSIHCVLGEICDPATSTCRAGCRSTADCALGDICEGGSCIDGQPGNDCSRCSVDPVTGPDPDYCDYGESCSSASSSFQQCVPHSRSDDLCDYCNSQAGPGCPSSMACLIDPTGNTQAGDGYCATTCDTSAECPSGYGTCNGLILVANGQCSSSDPCDNGSECLIGAEDGIGVCGCMSQSDCDIFSDFCVAGLCINDFSRSCGTGEDCACTDGSCVGTNLPCASNTDCLLECRQSTVGDRTFGQCVSRTKVCGKDPGLSCDTLKNDPAQCSALY